MQIQTWICPYMEIQTWTGEMNLGCELVEPPITRLVMMTFVHHVSQIYNVLQKSVTHVYAPLPTDAFAASAAGTPKPVA